MSSLTLQHASTNGGMIFLLCLHWGVIGFFFLISFLSKNKDFRRAVNTFGRLPLFAQAIFIAVISSIIVFGGSKPGGTKPFNFNTWFFGGAPDSTPSLSEAQKAAGFGAHFVGSGQWAVGSGQFSYTNEEYYGCEKL
jgi:hypothetical protein